MLPLPLPNVSLLSLHLKPVYSVSILKKPSSNTFWIKPGKSRNKIILATRGLIYCDSALFSVKLRKLHFLYSLRMAISLKLGLQDARVARVSLISCRTRVVSRGRIAIFYSTSLISLSASFEHDIQVTVKSYFVEIWCLGLNANST